MFVQNFVDKDIRTYKLISFNFNFCHDENWEKFKQDVTRLDPDILALQDIESEKMNEVKNFMEGYVSDYYCSSEDSKRAEKLTLMMFVKKNIKTNLFIGSGLIKPIGFECGYIRTLIVDLMINDSELRIINVNLKSTLNSDQIRIAQLNEIKPSIKKSTIIIGNFNDDPYSKTIQALQSFKSVYPLNKSLMQTTKYIFYNDPCIKIFSVLNIPNFDKEVFSEMIGCVFMM